MDSYFSFDIKTSEKNKNSFIKDITHLEPRAVKLTSPYDFDITCDVKYKKRKTSVPSVISFCNLCIYYRAFTREQMMLSLSHWMLKIAELIGVVLEVTDERVVYAEGHLS